MSFYLQKDGHVTLEGNLRVHWGVEANIKFKKDDSHEATLFTNRMKARRVNKTRSFHTDLYGDVPEMQVCKKDVCCREQWIFFYLCRFNIIHVVGMLIHVGCALIKGCLECDHQVK